MKFGVISGGTSWPWLSYGEETCKGMLGGGVLGHPFTARHWPSPSSRAAWPRDAVFEKDAGNSFLGRRFLWGPRSSDFSGAETVGGGSTNAVAVPRPSAHAPRDQAAPGGCPEGRKDARCFSPRSRHSFPRLPRRLSTSPFCVLVFKICCCLVISIDYNDFLSARPGKP